MIGSSEWNGSVFIWRRRIIFVGEAGTSKDQTVHAIKICIALGGDFELNIGSRTKGKRYSVAIISPGIKHTIICDREEILLIYLLPETEESKKISAQYLNEGRRRVCELQPLQLQQLGRGYSKWNCDKAKEVCNEVINSLGAVSQRKLSPSTKLSKELNRNVRDTIDYIYSEIDAQLKTSRFDKTRFTTLVIARELGVRESKLVKDFKRQVGVTIPHWFNDIYLLIFLEQYAVKRAERVKEERRLLTALENAKEKKEREKIENQLREIPGRIYEKEIAEALGFKLFTLCQRVKSRLGISLRDLEDATFIACPKDVD
jgi:AraC-like DNA-binding protein